MSALSLKDYVVESDQSLDQSRERDLLQMMENGGLSKFIALVNSGVITDDEAARLAEKYAQLHLNADGSFIQAVRVLLTGTSKPMSGV